MGQIQTYKTGDMTWHANLYGLEGLLLRAARQRYRLALREALKLAEEAAEWMKDNAPWEDQTGRARASLECVVIEDVRNKSFSIIFKGGGNEAPHMVFLEFDNAGKFSIIEPALEHWAPIFRERLEEAMRS